MTKRSADEKYTDPDLRERIKEEIKASDKGGRPGQWSARKSQLLTREYEKRGGGYVGDKDDFQKDLEHWTGEEWQTRDGEANARQGGETKRYLPKKAWESMSEDERRATDARKREGSRRGAQHVSNTEEAKRARSEAQAPPIEGYDDLNVGEARERLQDLSDEEVRQVRDYEKQHKNRKTLVRAFERRLKDPA